MAELARSIQGKMIISVNDIPTMLKTFDGLTTDTVGGNSTKESLFVTGRINWQGRRTLVQ